MAYNESEILHNQLQLCQWQDELEFLCFVLCDVIMSSETTDRKTSQTLDLLKFVEIINEECESPQGRLRELLSKNERSELKSCLRKTKKIRNIVAHHVPINDRVMVKKQAVAKSTMATLESVIRRGAGRYKIDQVNWYPIAHTSTTIPDAKDFFKVGIVLSGASVLSIRQVYLQRGAYCQEYLSKEQERWLHDERQRLLQSSNRKAGRPSRKSNKKKGLGKTPQSNRITLGRKRENINRKQNGQKDTKNAQLSARWSLFIVGWFALSWERCSPVLEYLILLYFLASLVYCG